jgi:two-component system, NtrC family, sensor histidine kinase PilS
VVELAAPPEAPSPLEQQLLRADLLRWLYVSRLTLVTGILVAALVVWFDARRVDTLIVIVMFILAGGVTSASYWFTHILKRGPGETFLYAQVILDALLVTGVVHLTGGAESGFASLYILVISAGALLLPLPGGVLIGALVSILYFADLVWGFQELFTISVALRIGLFTLVAIITGLLGDRLRSAGQALGAVASELQQLRLDTGDILANLSTGVVTVHGDGRLAYANPAAGALLESSLDSMLGRPILDEMDRIAPGMGAMLQKAIRQRSPVSRGRVEVAGSSPTTRLGVSTAVLERGAGELPSATALFQDITDLERLGELNVRAERSEAVATLSASLAHEIKNPLASIRSAVEQLAGGRLVSGDRGVLERLVLSETDRLSRLLSEFLEYTGLGVNAREEVEMNALVRGCLLLAKQHPDLKGVKVITTLDDGPISMIGDADLLHRALFNLVLNGAQSAGPSGCVSVTLKNEMARSHPRGTHITHPIRVGVSDNGPGIPEDERARIFDPFFTTKSGGSGLGLAVVDRAVEAHSGATFVEESRDGGASFVIFLPGSPSTLDIEHNGVVE